MKTLRLVGSFFSDVARVIVGDPGKLVADEPDRGGPPIMYTDLIDMALASDGRKPCEYVMDKHNNVGAIMFGTGADGWHRVYLDKDKRFLVIDLTPRVTPE